MSKIERIGIIGAGLMGAEIAYAISSFDKYVILKDVCPDQLSIAFEKCKSHYERYLKKGKLTKEDIEKKLDLINVTLDYNNFSSLDLIIEAVPENIETKKTIFNEIDKICNEYTIFATNTSGLSITEISTSTSRQNKFIGMHFFYPASIMKLVEVIKGKYTDDNTVHSIKDFCREIRKIPVEVKECPGFLVNRILCALLLYAIKCYEEGYSKELIDNSMKSPEIGLPAGPFLIADNIGIDIIFDTIKLLTTHYSDRFYLPETLSNLMSNNKLGIKTGEGFYKYPKDTENSSNKDLKLAIRVMKAAVDEARKCLEEEIADKDSIDLAMRAGAGFRKPPFIFAQEYEI